MAIVIALSVQAYAADFSGVWSIDLRTPEQRSQDMECGRAEFRLTQQKDRIFGSHSMSTVGCGRLNEGNSESVKGVVINGIAALVVTSSRNGASVLGRARVHGSQMNWEVLDEVHGGEPPGDSPLILERGTLTRLAE